MQKNKYFVFDTETNGLNLITVKPWQMSGILYHGKEQKKVIDLYIDWPDLNLSDEIKRLTRFDQEKYDRLKMSKEKAWEIFSPYIFDPSITLVGQNLLGYDVYVLASLQRYLGQKPDFSYLPRIYDTRPLAKAFRHSLRKPKSDLLFWQYKILHDRSLKGSVSQTNILKLLGIDFDEHMLHEAIYDSTKCFEAFWSLKNKLELPC